MSKCEKQHPQKKDSQSHHSSATGKEIMLQQFQQAIAVMAANLKQTQSKYSTDYIIEGH